MNIYYFGLVGALRSGYRFLSLPQTNKVLKKCESKIILCWRIGNLPHSKKVTKLVARSQTVSQIPLSFAIFYYRHSNL
jgi:hypothetical protein